MTRKFHKKKYNKKPFNINSKKFYHNYNITCFICKLKEYIARNCYAKKQIQKLPNELQILNSKQIWTKIDQLELYSTDLDNSEYNSSTSASQTDSINSDNSGIEGMCLYNHKINVLTDYSSILEQINKIEDPKLKWNFLKHISKTI